MNLPVPGSDLSVSVASPGAPTEAAAPGRAALVLAVASATPLPILVRACAGRPTPPFTTGRLVAVFRLLPEVEARLAALLADVPPADGTPVTPGLVTRATVRTFALELPETPPTLTLLETGSTRRSRVSLRRPRRRRRSASPRPAATSTTAPTR